MPNVKVASLDLNGTLVKQHTMSHMIQLYVGEEQYRRAKEIFDAQTAGRATMEEAFRTAGPLSRGITLRQAIEYTRTEMQYIAGFPEFTAALEAASIPLVINSTGYSVTIYAIREQFPGRIHGHIGNSLLFGPDDKPGNRLLEEEVEELVTAYFRNPSAKKSPVYDQMYAIGVVELGIADEAAKAALIQNYVARNFPGVWPRDIAHGGDTMGDSGGIAGIARAGGTGIAFNYNEELRRFVEGLEPTTRARVHLVDSKGEHSDLRHLLPLLLRQ